MAIHNMTVKEFNSLVKYLKRLDDIGDDFYLVGDVILPSVRTPKNRPGKHIVRSMIPTLSEYEDIVYGIANLSETSKLLGDVKGKKTLLCIEQTEEGIWISVNDLKVQLAGIYGEDCQDIVSNTAPNKNCFDEYLDEVNEWIEIPHETLNSLKVGNVLTIEDTRHTTKVRVAKDLFKLKGVSRLSLPVDYTAFVHVTSPVPNENTLVIGSSPSNGLLSIYFKSSVIEAIHYYSFSPFY